MEYQVEMRDDAGCVETECFEADSEQEAIDYTYQYVKDWVESWCKDGEWGDEGAAVEVRWALFSGKNENDEFENKIDSDYVTIFIKPNHDALIKAVADNPDCEHDWTSQGEGGLKENPGVWGGSGTSLVLKSHCRKCGLHKTEYHTGSQRNPGEHDTVEYRQLTSEEMASRYEV